MRAGRDGQSLSLNRAAQAGSDVLIAWGMEDLTFEFDYPRWLESRPPTPLASPHRLSAMVVVYRLVWPQVLEILGVEPVARHGQAMRIVGDSRQAPLTQPEADARNRACLRCGKPASYHWQLCADAGVFRPLCQGCDAELQEMVLRWAGDPESAAKVEAHRAACGIL